MARFWTRRSPNAARCLCRPISPPAGRRTRRTGPTTRPFSPMRKAPWPRRRPACISRTGCWRGSRSAASALHKVTLHVGAGTFLPVKADDTAGHNMHAEFGTRLGRDGGGAQRGARQRRAHRGGRLDRAAATGKRRRRRRPPASLFRRDLDLHHAGLQIPRRRPDADQFPPAALDPVHAGCGLQRARHHEARLCACDRGPAIASIPTAMRVCCILSREPS